MVPVRGTQAPLHAVDSGGNGRGFRGAFWQGIAEGVDRHSQLPADSLPRFTGRFQLEDPQCLPAACAFFPPATTRWNRPTSELSSALRAHAVGHRAAPADQADQQDQLELAAAGGFHEFVARLAVAFGAETPVSTHSATASMQAAKSGAREWIVQMAR